LPFWLHETPKSNDINTITVPDKEDRPRRPDNGVRTRRIHFEAFLPAQWAASIDAWIKPAKKSRSPGHEAIPPG
jgi:hypothetical protein